MLCTWIKMQICLRKYQNSKRGAWLRTTHNLLVIGNGWLPPFDSSPGLGRYSTELECFSLWKTSAYLYMDFLSLKHVRRRISIHWSMTRVKSQLQPQCGFSFFLFERMFLCHLTYFKHRKWRRKNQIHAISETKQTKL